MPPKPKVIVSTSGIFKDQRNRKALDNAARRKPRYHAKEPKFEHVIAQQFSQSIERSREAILNDAVGFTQLTHSNYINEIAASENSLRSKRDQLSDHCKELDLCKPLSKDLLKFQDTNRTFEIPLGERMDGFRDRIAKTEQKLARLWKEWELIQNQILSFGEEVLGSQGVDVIGSTMAGLLNEETEKLSQDLAMDKAKCAEEIEAMYEEAIRKMRDNEKELEIATREQQKAFIQNLLVDI